MPRNMGGYLDAVAPGQGCEVVPGGRARWIPRARLGLHLRLARLAEQVSDALGRRDIPAAAASIRAYCLAAGCPSDGASGAQLAAAYARLVQTNGLRWLLPFMKAQAPPGKAPAYDYPDRVYAWWVHKLASRYGWTRPEVEALWPEEAACYLQEIFVAEYDEADERRSLSEMAYQYNKHTRAATFRPLPRPNWMVVRGDREPRRIRRDMLPVGVIVNLSRPPASV
jgi:hypothetical protein